MEVAAFICETSLLRALKFSVETRKSEIFKDETDEAIVIMQIRNTQSSS